MAYSYEVDRDHRVVRVRMSGSLTLAEVHQVVAQIAADPGVTGHFVELIDLREATTDKISADDVRNIAAATLDATTRRAFVTSDVLTYGLARMFEIYRTLSRKQDEIAVFRHIADAEQWLGVLPAPEMRDPGDARRSGQ